VGLPGLSNRVHILMLKYSPFIFRSYIIVFHLSLTDLQKRGIFVSPYPKEEIGC